MDPALRELLQTDTQTADEVEAIIRLDRSIDHIEGIRIVTRFGPIATCRIPKTAIRATRKHAGVRSLKPARLFGPEKEPPRTHVDQERVPLPGDQRRPDNLMLTGAGVVIAVVDWGCDFAHPNFRLADGSTRLTAFWDQRGTPTPGYPNRYGYGRIYSRRQINQALSSPSPYNALGCHPADADPDGKGSHGCHVMDIAAGNGANGGPVGVAPEADLIFVHLSNQGTSGLANLGDSVRIIEAVDFVARAAGRRPWVINLSVGRHGGPHDGSTLAEMAFDAALRTAPGRFIVQSAGNYFNKNIHLDGRLRPNQTQSFDLRIDADDVTPNELEVWYSGQDAISIRVESPTGFRFDWVKLEYERDIIIDGVIVGRIYNRRQDPNNADNIIHTFLYPTAPPGLWRVTLRGDRIFSGLFHAWLERDEACARCQAHFKDLETDNQYTIGTLANGRIPLVVGAYDAHSSDRTVAPFSSAGPTRDNRPKPDLAAPGVDVLAARSAPHGWRDNSGLMIRKSGTSMAAPHVTGTVALCLQGARRPLGWNEIRELILTSTEPAAASGLQALRLGHGYLDIIKVVERVSAAAPVVAASAGDRPEDEQRSSQWPKEGVMKTNIDEFFNHLEKNILKAVSPPDSERQVLASTLGVTEASHENIFDPDALYRTIIASSSTGGGENFSVLAGPAEPPVAPPRSGDVLLRVALGEPGLGHAAVLSDAVLWPHDRLTEAPFRTESRLPGFYAKVIEGGTYEHTRSDPFARRILDGTGRMLPGQLLLRPKISREISPFADDQEDAALSTQPTDQNRTRFQYPLFEADSESEILTEILTEESPSVRRKDKRRFTNIQLRVLNYRGTPLEHYYISAYIVDIRSGEKVLLGESKAVAKAADTGSLGVITLPKERVPYRGSLVINAYPIYTESGSGKLRTKGEFVGDFLSGSMVWHRRKRNMLLNVIQANQEIIVKAGNREEAQAKIKKDGKIGFVLGPIEIGGGVGSEKGIVKGSEVSLEYKVQIALSQLNITDTGAPAREEMEFLPLTGDDSAAGEDDHFGIKAFASGGGYSLDDPLSVPFEGMTDDGIGESESDALSLLEMERTLDAAEADDGPPSTAIVGDIAAIADDIIKRPEKTKQTMMNRHFGSRLMAELLRTLAAWRKPEISPAYNRLMQWNLEFFYNSPSSLQKRFVSTITALRGPGAVRGRLDVTISFIDMLLEHNPEHPASGEKDERGRLKQRNGAVMLAAGGYLAKLVGGETGVRMVQRLETSNLERHGRRLFAQILIWHWVGQRTIGELLGRMSYLIALQSKAGVHRVSGRLYTEEDVFKAQASLLGRTIAHVEMAVEEWAAAKAKRNSKASAAHGAAIVNFALDMVVFLLPGMVSKVVDSTVATIRDGVKKLEAYETGRQRSAEDPREVLKDYMLEAARLPFFHLMITMVENGQIEEEDRQVLVERFRDNMIKGRKNALTWS